MVSALLLGVMLGLLQPAHPMHTSVTELHDSAAGTVSIRIRVFEDDLTAALGGRLADQAADSALSRYVRGRLSLSDRTGRVLPIEWVADERAGAVRLLRLRAKVSGGLAGASLNVTLLCDRFDDQVNIVRASYGGRTTTILFTPGDGAKALP